MVPQALRSREDVLSFKARADALASNPDAFRTFVDSYRSTPDPSPRIDPHSPEYREWVMAQYMAMTGHAYSEVYEAHAFDEASLSETPWPYITGSAQEVGGHLMAIGAVICAMNLQPAQRVLECGIGWGNLAIQLARYGVAVEAIDIESKYLRLVKLQSDRAGVSLHVHVETFMDGLRRRPDAAYDAVLFFEAFHHSPDHLAMMREAKRILKPGGKLVLAGETVETNLEYPWGMNPGGIAVYTVAMHGWLELALREDYLLDTFVRAGFTPRRVPGPNAAGIVYIGE